MTTEVKKEDDPKKDEPTEVDEKELLDVLSSAVDEVTPDEVLAANKTVVELTPAELEAKAAEDKVAEDKVAAEEKTAAEEKAAADEKAAAEAFEKLTPEEKVAAEKAAEDKAAEEKVAADKLAAEELAKLTPEEKVAFETKAAEDKAAEEKAVADAAAKLDPINDPIPESTKAETATRIKALIEIAKTNTTRAEQVDEIVEQITATGAGPEQYANTLGFLRLYNSTDPKDRAQALAAAEGVVRELRVELGQGTAELLADHEDLRAEIEADTLTEKRAIEIATGREKVKLDAERAEAAKNKTTSEADTLNLIAQGKAQLTTLEATLNASDTDYARLRPTFIAMLKPALRKTHASEWGEVAQQIYLAVKEANPLVEKPTVTVPVNTPLRPKGSGGGSSTVESQPDTALAAVNAALGSM